MWPAERIWDRIRADVLAGRKNISVTEGAAQAPVEPLGRAGSVGNDFPRRLRVTFKKVLLNRSKFSCRNRFSRLGARPGRETPNSISARRKGRKGTSGWQIFPKSRNHFSEIDLRNFRKYFLNRRKIIFCESIFKNPDVLKRKKNVPSHPAP